MLSYIFIYVFYTICLATCTFCGLLLARFFQRFQDGHKKYIQILIGYFSFLPGIIIGWVVILFLIWLTGIRGYSIQTALYWLLLTNCLQTFINFFVVCWNILKNQTLGSSRLQLTLLLLCGLAVLIFVEVIPRIGETFYL